MLASEHYLHAKYLVQVAYPHCGHCFVCCRNCPCEWSRPPRLPMPWKSVCRSCVAMLWPGAVIGSEGPWKKFLQWSSQNGRCAECWPWTGQEVARGWWAACSIAGSLGTLRCWVAPQCSVANIQRWASLSGCCGWCADTSGWQMGDSSTAAWGVSESLGASKEGWVRQKWVLIKFIFLLEVVCSSHGAVL